MPYSNEIWGAKMGKKGKNIDKIILGILAILILLMANNQFKLNRMSDMSSMGFAAAAEVQTGTASASSVMPQGIPEIYGSELGVSYDDISPYDQQKADAAIRKLGYLDDATPLDENELKRYISIVSKISCEYCCGAESIIFSNGQAACGCAHSYAMRGLAKYLITEHPGEFTDDQVLEELGKWKTLFFPGQMEAKAQILAEKGIELNYINLASNKYRGIEQGASGSGMVGGC